MTELADLIRTEPRSTVAVRALIVEAGTELHVTVESFDGGRVRWGPCAGWTPGAAEVGDEVVVVFDEYETPWVMVGGGGGGDPGPVGPQGPVGPPGPEGPEGDMGPQGPIGETGATGAPGATGATGATGSPGATGSAGTPGEKWFTQAGAPAGATGIVGDWSLDSSSGDFYEKTGASAWTLRGNLKGPQGIQGPQGPQGNAGATGSTGSTGSAGAPGEKWFAQAGAPAGATGIVGDWSLDTATGDVYEKTGASAWTLRANIKGPQGIQGATGSQGIQGPQGATGSTGSTGSAGTPGEKWFVQAGAPAGATGIVGDWSLDSTSGDVYEKTGASAWTLRGNLKGPQGATGATGATGSTGSTGSQGPAGSQGPQGVPGSVEVYEQPAQPASTNTGALWIDTDDVPPTWQSLVPVVGVLPTSPLDGAEVYYAPVVGQLWHLRYDASISDAYKWVSLGGSALHAATDGTVNTSSGSPSDGDNPGPSVTVPLKGIYDVENCGVGIIFYNASNMELELWLKNGAAAAVRVCSFRTVTANLWGFLHAPRRRITVLAASDVVKMQYACTAAGGTMSASMRAFGLRPVRVG